MESNELLGLKEGELSTTREDRTNEYIHEHSTKDKRQADFVIFVDSEIVIPVEAERFGNISAGEIQLMNYQQDLDKQYGILTDGYTWRFYKNNIYRSFGLDYIFDNTSEFLEFWSEYIKPENYYLSFFEPPDQPTLWRVELLPVEDYTTTFFEHITSLINKFKNLLKVEGYFNGVPEKEKERKAVEITYAYIIQFVLYKTLVDNDYADFKDEFDAKVKNIYSYLVGKRYKDILGVVYGISKEISKDIYRPFTAEQQLITKKLLDLLPIENELSDVSPWLEIFIFIKKFNFANIQNEIFGYVYENYLKALYGHEDLGQYFTDPAIVNLMLDAVGYDKTMIRQRLTNGPEGNYISIIDPACGSGTFLYQAVNHIADAIADDSAESSRRIEKLVGENVFGLDIAEFPLYLAEMSILMRMLPHIITEKYNNPVDKKVKVFKTKDSIAEFMDTALRNTDCDKAIVAEGGGGQMMLLSEDINLGYTSFVRDEDDLSSMKKSLENQPEFQIPRRRFDFVLANPPYVGYNKSSKQGTLSFDLLKEKKIKLNDIYGVNLHSAPGRRKKHRPNPNLYVFFLALGLALLKDNGVLCYIVPQTLLTSGDHDVLRYHLAKFTEIEKLVTFPNPLFIGRGLKQKNKVATSSLIIVARRSMPADGHEVEVVNYEKPDADIEETVKNIKHRKSTTFKAVKQELLLKNISSWNFISRDSSYLKLHADFAKTSNDIAVYYDHQQAKKEFGSVFIFDSGYAIDEKLMLEEKPSGDYYLYPRINNNYWSIKESRGYWPNVRTGDDPRMIGLRQANQGYSLLDTKHKVVWSYANPRRFFYTSESVIWPRNQFCAIGSDNEEELLYLFALLNSPVINLLLNGNLKVETEKDFLVSTTSIKDFVRVPSITSDNQHVKNEIINKTSVILHLDTNTLSDFVDFKGLGIQKFDQVYVEQDKVVLTAGGKSYRLQITKQRKTVDRVVSEMFGEKAPLLLESRIPLASLRSLPAIDHETQNKTKAYIDDLVFSLYFGVPLTSLGINNAGKIRLQCSKHPHYETVRRESPNLYSNT